MRAQTRRHNQTGAGAFWAMTSGSGRDCGTKMMNCPCARYEIFQRPLDWRPPAETSGSLGRKPAQARPSPGWPPLSSLVGPLWFDWRRLSQPAGLLLADASREVPPVAKRGRAHPRAQLESSPPDWANYINKQISPGETQSQLEACQQQQDEQEELDNSLLDMSPASTAANLECAAVGGSKYCRVTVEQASIACCCLKDGPSGQGKWLCIVQVSCRLRNPIQ